MSKVYQRKGTRSRRKVSTPRGRVVGVDEASVQLSLPIAEILAETSATIEALAADAGLLVMRALIDDEAAARTGPRYAHDPQRRATRWGNEDGYVTYAGRKVPIVRPRVRSADGREVRLERYDLFKRDSRMQQAVNDRVVRGISMRDYEGVIDAVCDGYGVRKSSVSRHWKVASAKRLKELLERPLGDLDLAAIMIDGIEFHEYVLIAALGIDSDGRKYVLGLRPGGSENAGVCTALLEDLASRGLSTDTEYLFVLDGSKALRKAVTGMFGKDAVVQRCHRHKERNVLDHLPEQYRTVAGMRLRVAWNMTSYEDAKKELTKALRYLEGLNGAAAESLREAFEDTLTVHRLGIPELLRRTLSSTNPIESCFSTTRDRCGNVKHWKTSDMAMRWAGTMLLEAESRFHRVKGFRQLPILVSAVRPAVDRQEARA